jgi:hypothetical protein
MKTNELMKAKGLPRYSSTKSLRFLSRLQNMQQAKSLGMSITHRRLKGVIFNFNDLHAIIVPTHNVL